MDKTPLYLTGNTSWETLLTVVRVPGIIVNQGFPFHYLSGDLQLWEIFFSESEYVNLVVYNTSFNRNQVIQQFTLYNFITQYGINLAPRLLHLNCL